MCGVHYSNEVDAFVCCGVVHCQQSLEMTLYTMFFECFILEVNNNLALTCCNAQVFTIISIKKQKRGYL